MWRKSSIAGAFLALTLLLAGCNSGAYSKNTQGNLLFAEGKLDEALEAYQNAQVEDPDAPQPHYNAGNVLHEQAAYSEAITETLNALNGADSTLASWVNYNVGNSAFHLGQYEQAIEQYKTTLRTDPDDWDAKLNLEIAQQRLEQQQDQTCDNPQQSEDRQDQQDQQQDQQQQNEQQQDQQQQDQQQQDEQQQDQQQQDQQQQDQQQQDQQQQDQQQQDQQQQDQQQQDQQQQDQQQQDQQQQDQQQQDQQQQDQQQQDQQQQGQQQDQQQDQQQEQQHNQGQRATPTPTPTPTPQTGEQTQPSVGTGTPTPAPEGTEQAPLQLSAADLENMTREQALQLLGALAQEDETLQEHLQKLQPKPSNPNVRDW